MKVIIKLTAISVFLAALTSCGDNTAENKSVSVSVNANTTAMQNQSDTTANTMTTAATAANNQPNQLTVENQKKSDAPANSTMENMALKPPPKTENPAPDNSTISVEMNSKGFPVETRTFKSDATLTKIEKITMSPRDYVYKIYLKNGKVVDSKSDKLKDFRVIAPANILDAIGMLPPPPKPNPNAPPKEEKGKPILIPRANQ